MLCDFMLESRCTVNQVDGGRRLVVFSTIQGWLVQMSVALRMALVYCLKSTCRIRF